MVGRIAPAGCSSSLAPPIATAPVIVTARHRPAAARAAGSPARRGSLRHWCQFWVLLLAPALTPAACTFGTGAESLLPTTAATVAERNADGVDRGTPVDLMAQAADYEANDYSPFLRPDGRPYRVAVVQSGEYYAYNEVLEGVFRGFAALGWIDEAVPSSAGLRMDQYLDALATVGGHVRVNRAAFFDFDWDRSNAESAEFAAFAAGTFAAGTFAAGTFAAGTSASGAADIDIVISLGTLAGQVFAGFEEFPYPVLADSISDPVGAAIIPSYADSGRSFLTVRGDPNRYDRQLRLFHDVVQFSRLGVIYSDSVVGRSYAAYDSVAALARDRGFEVIADTRVVEDPPEAQIPAAEAAYIAAVEALAPRVDAMYLAIQAGLTEAAVPRVVEVLERYGVPSFAMEGSIHVGAGVLFGVSDAELESTGVHNARNIVKIFRGTEPRAIDQVFEHVPTIAINLAAADRIGYAVPVDILVSSDQVYR